MKSDTGEFYGNCKTVSLLTEIRKFWCTFLYVRTLTFCAAHGAIPLILNCITFARKWKKNTKELEHQIYRGANVPQQVYHTSFLTSIKQATIITHNLSQLALGTLVQQEPVKLNQFGDEAIGGMIQGLIPGKVQEIFLFSKTYRPMRGPTQSPIQWAAWVLSPMVKWLRCEADYPPPPTAKLRMCATTDLPTHKFTFLPFTLVYYVSNQCSISQIPWCIRWCNTYVVWQFNSRNGPVKAKFAYLRTSGWCHNTLLVKLCTSWNNGATARNTPENCFLGYLALTFSHCVGCQNSKQIFVPSGHLLILERAKNRRGLSQVNKVDGPFL